MKDFSKVEKLTQGYADARDQLMEVIGTMKAEMEEISRKHGKDVRKAVRKTADALALLKTELENSKELFDKPKSQIFSGVKVGFHKKIGEILVQDEEQTVALIKKILPGKKDLLIKTKETVVKAAMKNLEVGELKRIGAEVKADYDEVLIKPVDSSVEKVTDAVLKSLDIDVEKEVEEAEAQPA